LYIYIIYINTTKFETTFWFTIESILNDILLEYYIN